MDQQSQQGLPASLTSGRLEGLSVPDLLWKLCGRRSTGVLHLTSRGITKKVYIDFGRIIFALSGDPDDRLSNLLFREGTISLDQFEEARAKLSSGKRFGTILVDAGHLAPEHLVRGVVSQVRSIVLGLFPWEEGEYSFIQGPLPTDEVITLGMRTAEILLEGIRQIRSFSRIRRSVGPPSNRFRLDPGWHSVLDGLDIRDGERMLLQRLDEAGPVGMPVDALCREVFLSNFEIYQSLWAFLVLGVVAEVDRSHLPVSGTAAGRAEHATLPEILVRLCHDGLTGVLHMAHGAVERTLHIKEGQCVFATSNAVDDGLVAHLLRRGVISLADREETARRLLSNKRVGTILVDMGVIDEDDLKSVVREQLSEIIFDSFRWDHGEFQFLEGELPTVEEITLSRTVEDLVFEGVRRITSWPRVREGCGGLSARLVLLPEYLAVLDRTTVGPEEWALISSIKTPKSLLEICRESVLGDFRSCQILWALRLLGGVGEAPIEDSIDTALGLATLPARAPEEPTVAQHIPHFEPEIARKAPEAPPQPVWAGEPEKATEPAPQSEPVRAMEPEHVPETEPQPERVTEPAPAFEAQPEPEVVLPVPVSQADESAEVISEPWRLAEERRPEPVPAPPPAHLQIDSPADATIYIPREDVEAALRGPVDDQPRFELGEPGVALESTNIDMLPDASPAAHAPDDHVDRQPENRDEVPAVMDSHDRAGHAHVELPEPTPAMTVDLPPWEPPLNLDADIASFNARHVVLFRALRTEVGAGATNFVRSCRIALDPSFSQMFASAGLRADGSWDPEGLRQAVIDHRIHNATDAFWELLDGELQKLRVHMGDAKTAVLAGQLTVIR